MKKDQKIVIIDYGMGNIGSIVNMFKYLGIAALVSSDKEIISSADKLILPGVGNFDKAVQGNTSILFNENACNFLISLSESILKDSECREHGDVVAFAYWCRSSSLKKIRSQYSNSEIRKGRGVAFHIAPSNVPINFAFSFAFSLLAGNSNVVRLPSKQFPQEDFFFKHFDIVTSISEFMEIRNSNVFVR